MNFELAFVFPTYFEEINILKRFEEIKSLAHQIHGKVEIIISDDTPSSELLEKKIEQLNINKEIKIRYIARNKQKKKKGLAFSILSGLEIAKSNYICVADVDGQHNMFDAIRLYNYSKKSRIIAIGSRFLKKGGMHSPYHYFLSYIFNLWLIQIIGVKCLDKTGGFFVMPSNINKIIIRSKQKIFWGYGDYFLRLIRFIYINKIPFCEIPVFYPARTSGSSKSNFFNMIFSYTFAALKSRLNIKSKKMRI